MYIYAVEPRLSGLIEKTIRFFLNIIFYNFFLRKKIIWNHKRLDYEGDDTKT